jgi:hypothetical protein
MEGLAMSTPVAIPPRSAPPTRAGPALLPPRSSEEAGRTTLMIKKLHHTVTMKGLMQAFGQYGGIVGCKVGRRTRTQQRSCRSAMCFSR